MSENEFTLKSYGTNWDDEIKGRQRMFVWYYCTDKDCFMNSTASYQKAFSTRTKTLDREVCRTASAKLMSKDGIKKATKLLLKSAQNESDERMTYQLLKMYETLAFYNPSDLIDATGALRVSDLRELGEKAMCIKNIKTTNRNLGERGVVTETEIELVDRMPYARDLLKYLDLIRQESAINISIPIVKITDKKELVEVEDVRRIIR